MYHYNKVVSRVVTTEEEFRTWVATEVSEHHEYLTSKNCCGCHIQLEESWNSPPMPARYPVFAQLSFKGGWNAFPTYIYPDQIMELLGLKGLMFERDAVEQGLAFASYSDEYGGSGVYKLSRTVAMSAPAEVETELVPAGSIEDRMV